MTPKLSINETHWRQHFFAFPKTPLANSTSVLRVPFS